MRHELVELFERAGIEEQFHALTRRQLAGVVMAFQPIFAAAELRLTFEARQFLQGSFHAFAPLAFSQSFRNRSMPMSVSGCLKSASMTDGGHVHTSAPIRAAWTMCIGLPGAGDEDLGLEVVVVVDLDDLLDEFHAVGRDVVETADERADEGGANLGGEQRLGRREHQRHVDAECPSVRRVLHARTPSFVNGTFTTTCGSIVASSRPSRIMPSASVDSTSALTGPLTISQMRLTISRLSPGFFRHQRRIRGHAVDDADGDVGFDVLDAAGVEKELHGSSLWLSGR